MSAAVAHGKSHGFGSMGVVEIVSTDDKLPEQLERFADYKKLGVLHVVVLDPERLLAFRFEKGSLIQTRFTSLELPPSKVPFESDAIFKEFQEERNSARE